MFNYISTPTYLYCDFKKARRSCGIEIDEVAYNVAYSLGIIDPDLDIFDDVGVGVIEKVLNILNPVVFEETNQNSENFTPVYFLDDASMTEITLFLEKNNVFREPSLDAVLSLLQIEPSR